MGTPILTQEQQKRTLSAKKGPVKGLRNVLAQPYDTFWPVLKNDEGGVLEKQLRELMSPLKRTKTSIAWSQLRKMTREERSSLKKASQENDEISPLNKFVVTGINAITRGMERNDLCSVLLDSNAESMVVKHIVTMAENGNVPVLLIPFLKIVTLETIGFGSAAFALKNDVKNSTDHHFRPLYEKISELSAGFIRPKQLVQSFPKEISEDETTENMPSQDLDREIVKIETVPTFVISSNVYLYRSSTRERVFIPERLNSTVVPAPAAKEWTDFIPLGENASLNSSSDTDVSKRIKKRGAKIERYMDFCDEIGALDEKLSVTNDHGQIFGFIDTNTTEEINKNISSEVSEEVESSKDKREIKRSSTTTFSYVPLKVKRMQGNSNRIKATKTPKPKKK